jgi:hypothetical protein
VPKPKKSNIQVQGREITILNIKGDDFISLTDMLKAKDGDFFISDWLRNRNTIEFLGIWESVHNPAFNYGEFATIKSLPQSGSLRATGNQTMTNCNAFKMASTDGNHCTQPRLGIRN